MKTFFFLKPDGNRHRNEIVQNYFSNVKIDDAIEFNMPKELCYEIYFRQVSDSVFKGLQEYLSEGTCYFAGVHMDTENLLQISGTSTNPALCTPDSIRKKYSSGVGFSKSGVEIVRNAIHRPKTIQQNEELHMLFSKYFLV